MDQFRLSKTFYNALREEERKIIIKHLKSYRRADDTPVFKCSFSGGNGAPDYGDRKTSPVFPAYDLTNWKYVEAVYNGIRVHISLQCFDVDPSSRNIHILNDRIGLYIYPQGTKNAKKVQMTYDDPLSGAPKKISFTDYILRMKVTPYELPLSKSDLDALAQTIIDEVNDFTNN